MSQPTPSGDRRRELQADRALFGLSDEEQRELAALETDRDADLPDEIELTAAALDIGLSAGENDALPELLRNKILAAAGRAIAAPAQTPTTQPPAATTRASSLQQSAPKFSRRRELLGWLAAAAATIAAVILGRSGEPSPAALRDRLLAQLQQQPNDVVQVSWTRGKDETGAAAEGDLVWSDREQNGVMRFRGLAANDPTKQQYQLWIVDPSRDKNPVDGGVFDIPAGANEVLVPIRAKLPVSKPTLFAVTVEKPGGVVVSDQSRMPLLAQVER